MGKFVSRRDFLNLLAATGGSAAVLRAGTALKMLPGSASAATLDLLHLGSNPVSYTHLTLPTNREV